MTSLEILTLTISVLSCIAAAGSAIYAKSALTRSDAANRTAEASLRFQVLVPALTEYRSPEMYVAISALWEFYGNIRDFETIGDAFLRDRELNAQRMSGLKPNEVSSYMRNTIDYYRRQVGQFYGLLTAIHDEGGYQRKWVYTYWGRRELRIIPEILIPLELALAKSLKAPVPSLSIERLNDLYDDCPR